ncbi:hypothetical protein U0070_020150 [Myodes glareolus]|uniref:Ribosomal protein eL8/eL30/eS12/Gadd45 domain-containing protein n=1 Tax=Myodes glareolus TaxID=447135 RepID=A0AAW0HPF6_MYOGA
MTLEELVASDNAAQKMQAVSAAVEQLLVAAQRQDRLTVGVYEAAKLMNHLHSRPPRQPCSWWGGGGDDTGLILAHSWCTVGLVTSHPPAVPELVPGAIPSVSSLLLKPPLSCRDPDSVVLCLLAIDEEEEDDIALQIHFTLIQSFCCDNDIDIVRVSGMQRLAQLLGEPAETLGTTEARDLHCLLVTNCHTDTWKSQGLVEVASYCEESRGNNQWVPYISLEER